MDSRGARRRARVIVIELSRPRALCSLRCISQLILSRFPSRDIFAAAGRSSPLFAPLSWGANREAIPFLRATAPRPLREPPCFKPLSTRPASLLRNCASGCLLTRLSGRTLSWRCPQRESGRQRAGQTLPESAQAPEIDCPRSERREALRDTIQSVQSGQFLLEFNNRRK